MSAGCLYLVQVVQLEPAMHIIKIQFLVLKCFSHTCKLECSHCLLLKPVQSYILVDIEQGDLCKRYASIGKDFQQILEYR